MVPAWISSAKPRPLSAGFHQMPVSGVPAAGVIAAPPVTTSKRSIGIVPPGQVSVPCELSVKIMLTSPALPVTTGAT